MNYRVAVLLVAVLGVGYAAGAGVITVDLDTAAGAIPPDSSEETATDRTDTPTSPAKETAERTTSGGDAIEATTIPRPTPTDTPTTSMPTTETTEAAADEVAGFEVVRLRDKTRDAINSYRDRNGYGEVRPGQLVRGAAQKHAVDMINRDYFAHESPDGETMADRLRAEGADPAGCGEILWQNTFTDGEHAGLEGDVAQQARDDWRASAEHREIMGDRGMDVVGVGAGIAESGQTIRIVLVAEFC